MATVNFIIPYFGLFPNYMQLFLNSCERNPNFHWTIITDNDEKYNYPQNVKKVAMSFAEVQSLVCGKFNFDVAFDRPYKLCDMKPMYGYIFNEYCEGYDYWGYCDVDLILGNLSNFLREDAFQCEKIFTQGHMTLIRNTERMNTMFMRPINGVELYKKVLSTDKPCNFDEDFLNIININTICRENGVQIYADMPIADIYTKSSDFRRVIPSGHEKKSKNYYIWNNGNLIRRIKRRTGWESEEFMYIHLQKRKMKVSPNLNAKIYKIIPNRFDSLEISEDTVGKNDDLVKMKYFNLHYFHIRMTNLKIKVRRMLKNECGNIEY